jgi:hypothetical protein
MNELGKNAGDKADHNGPENAHGCPTPIVCLLQTSAAEIVAPVEADDSAFAEEVVELK